MPEPSNNTRGRGVAKPRLKAPRIREAIHAVDLCSGARARPCCTGEGAGQAKHLAVAQRHHHRTLHRRRHRRSVRAPCRQSLPAGVRHGLRGRESRRRRRQSRCRRGRQGGARRLHAAAGHRQHPRHQSLSLQQAAVRRAEGLPAGQPDRAAAEHAGGESENSRQQRQ